MEKLLRRWTWLLDRAVIAIAAIAAAHAASQLLWQIRFCNLPQRLVEAYEVSEDETPVKKIEAISSQEIFFPDCESFAPKTSTATIVERRTLDAWLGDLGRGANEVRVMPETRDGKPAGLRLVGIRSGGLFAALGLRNGDVIQAINGLDLDSPDHALETYLKLRGASHISIAADRGGGRINLEYDIIR